MNPTFWEIVTLGNYELGWDMVWDMIKKKCMGGDPLGMHSSAWDSRAMGDAPLSRWDCRTYWACTEVHG